MRTADFRQFATHSEYKQLLYIAIVYAYSMTLTYLCNGTFLP